jgi:hypothetical protein
MTVVDLLAVVAGVAVALVLAAAPAFPPYVRVPAWYCAVIRVPPRLLRKYPLRGRPLGFARRTVRFRSSPCSSL